MLLDPGLSLASADAISRLLPEASSGLPSNGFSVNHLRVSTVIDRFLSLNALSVIRSVGISSLKPSPTTAGPSGRYTASPEASTETFPSDDVYEDLDEEQLRTVFLICVDSARRSVGRLRA